MKVLAIATNTAKEILRDRVLYAILVLGLLVIFSSKLVAPLSLDEDLRIVRDLGLSAIAVFSLLIGVIVGTRLVYDEIQRKTIYTILPKPVRRWQFILGKYLGISSALVLVVIFLAAGFLVYSLVFGYPVTPGFGPALLLTLLELLLVAAIAITFSTFTTPIGSGVFTFAIFFLGHFTHDLIAFGEMSQSALFRQLARVFYYVLPNLSYFNAKSEFVHNLPITADWITFAVSYCLFYVLVLLSIAVIVFERRDL